MVLGNCNKRMGTNTDNRPIKPNRQESSPHSFLLLTKLRLLTKEKSSKKENITSLQFFIIYFNCKPKGVVEVIEADCTCIHLPSCTPGFPLLSLTQPYPQNKKFSINYK